MTAKLAELIANDFGVAEDYNCAEKILYGANQAYGLGLDMDTARIIAGFGGGCGMEEYCGALAGALAVLSHYNVATVAHASDIKALSKEFHARYKEKMGSIVCADLKKAHRLPAPTGCKPVILAAAEILDEMIVDLKHV